MSHSTRAGTGAGTSSTTTPASTGVGGPDEILAGGLPARGLYLLDGSPGTGKTTLALQFLLAGRDRGERGPYVTLSESGEELGEVATSHGWSLEGLGVGQPLHEFQGVLTGVPRYVGEAGPRMHAQAPP